MRFGRCGGRFGEGWDQRLDVMQAAVGRDDGQQVSQPDGAVRGELVERQFARHHAGLGVDTEHVAGLLDGDQRIVDQ